MRGRRSTSAAAAKWKLVTTRQKGALGHLRQMKLAVRLVASAVVLLLAGGCERLSHRKEWECLDSERLKFKDPDSVKFMANLGTRGEGDDPEHFFWVRYAAKNGFGGYGQANMKCVLLGGKWTRFALGEELAVNAYRAKHGFSEEVKRAAEEAVHEGTGDLDRLPDDVLRPSKEAPKRAEMPPAKPALGGPKDVPVVVTAATVENGAMLYKDRGCIACHTLDGTRLVGPTWKGAFGKKEKLATGDEVLVDDAYLRESILAPMAKVVERYPPACSVMPLIPLEVESLILFIKAQLEPVAGKPIGEEGELAADPNKLLGGGKKDVGIGITSSDPTVMGSLDKELIRKVIHANRGQIRYCYESQLNRFPKLEGKVSVKFVISASGSVATSQVAGSTAGNAELETCVAGRVKTWMFPKPKGGGVVVVTYPFIFKQQG
jgi:TonB family protein